MENRTYLVTEAEKLTGEKAHVLRYWEDELGMEIHRNSLGHRCYTAQDIQIFLGIRELKKKGLHLNQIHDLNRSFEDMMLGLESWIPMYMTGQISPFYLKEPSNNVSGGSGRDGKGEAGSGNTGKSGRSAGGGCRSSARAGSRTAGGHRDAAGRGGASDGVLPRARPSA